MARGIPRRFTRKLHKVLQLTHYVILPLRQAGKSSAANLVVNVLANWMLFNREIHCYGFPTPLVASSKNLATNILNQRVPLNGFRCP